MGTSSQPTGVSICGVGAVTGYGWGQKLLRQGLVSGESAVRLSPGFGTHFDTDEVWVSLIEEGGDPADGKSRLRQGDPPRRPRGVRRRLRPGVASGRGSRPDQRRRARRRRRVARLPPQARLPHLEEGVAEPDALDGAVGDHAGVRHARAEHDGHRHVRVGRRLAPHGEDVDRCRPGDRRPGACDGPCRGPPRTSEPSATSACSSSTSPAFEACRPFQEGSRGFVGGEAVDRDDRVQAAFRLLRQHPRRGDVTRRVPRHLDQPRPQSRCSVPSGAPSTTRA